ncbi:MAG: HEPN domain-containing protein, partial [Petrotogales bacterium]
MNTEECYKKRMLRNIPPDLEKAKRSLEIAEKKLKTAKNAFEKELYGPTIIYGYTSMFHSSRALLYKDGVQEKSHICLVLYIKENYSKKIPPYLINSLNSFRKERHETLYGLD